MSENFYENVAATENVTQISDLDNQPKLEVKIGDWLKVGGELFAKDWLKYSVSLLIVSVISGACFVLLGPMYVGLYRCLLKKVKGEEFEYGDLFDDFEKQFLPSFVLVIVFLIPYVIVFIPCGLLIGTAYCLLTAPILCYMFIEMAVAEKAIEVGALLDLGKKVYARIKPQYFAFVLFFLLISVIFQIGIFVCCVGIFVSMAVASLTVAVSYADVFGLPKATETKVEAEPVNE